MEDPNMAPPNINNRIHRAKSGEGNEESNKKEGLFERRFGTIGRAKTLGNSLPRNTDLNALVKRAREMEEKQRNAASEAEQLNIHRPRRGTLILETEDDDEDGVSMQTHSSVNLSGSQKTIDYSKVNTGSRRMESKFDTQKIFEPYVRRSLSDPKKSWDGKVISDDAIDPTAGLDWKPDLSSLTVNSKPILPRQITASNLASLTDGKNKFPERRMSKRPAIPDYTSVTTGAFSDCMFNNDFDKAQNSALKPNKNERNDSLKPKTDLNEQRERRPSKAVYDESEKLAASKDKVVPNSLEDKTSSKPQLGTHPSQYHNTHKKHRHQKTPSQNFGSTDQKRLVNQFLQSIEKPLNNSTLNTSNTSAFVSSLSVGKYGGVFNIPQREDPPEFIDYSSSLSLQSLLYHDLADGNGQRKKNLRLLSAANLRPGSMTPSSYSSASLSSSIEASTNPGNSYSMISMNTGSEVALPMAAQRGGRSKAKNSDAGFTESNMQLNTNESDYYQQHITSQLAKLEHQIKHDLKAIVLKDEIELQNSLTSFDALTDDLQNLKSQIVKLKNTVENDYLIVLKADFDEKNPDSFQSQLRHTVDENVKQLEQLEQRMATCQKQLLEQKETMRKMESLLYLENSLMVSNQNTRLAYKYRYVVYDIMTLTVLFIIAYYIKKWLWN